MRLFDGVCKYPGGWGRGTNIHLVGMCDTIDRLSVWEQVYTQMALEIFKTFPKIWTLCMPCHETLKIT